MNNRNSPQLQMINEDIIPYRNISKSSTFAAFINRYFTPAKKGYLMKYLYYTLLIVMVVLLGMIIGTLYQYLQVVFLMQKSIALHMQLASQEQLLTKSIASENKKKIGCSLKSYARNMRIKKLQGVSEILEARIIQMKEKLSPNHDIFIAMLRQSVILKTIDEVELLYKWIPILRTDPYDVITIKLLYKGSKDGDSFLDFHRKCDSKGATLSIIKTKETEYTPSYILGGFTDVEFSSRKIMETFSQGYTFIYSLDFKERYRTLSGIKGIISGSATFLNYGNVMTVKEKWKTTGTLHFVSPYREDDHDHPPFPFKEMYYGIEEIEVFSVEIASEV